MSLLVGLVLAGLGELLGHDTSAGGVGRLRLDFHIPRVDRLYSQIHGGEILLNSSSHGASHAKYYGYHLVTKHGV